MKVFDNNVLLSKLISIRVQYHHKLNIQRTSKNSNPFRSRSLIDKYYVWQCNVKLNRAFYDKMCQLYLQIILEVPLNHLRNFLSILQTHIAQNILSLSYLNPSVYVREVSETRLLFTYERFPTLERQKWMRDHQFSPVEREIQRT